MNFEALLDRCPLTVALTKLLADAGYDSESNRELARKFHGIASLMPARHGQPPKGGKLPSGRCRRLMSRRLRTKRGRRESGYTQRWQVETVMSMIKRNIGEELGGQTNHSRNRQMRPLVVHNCMILWLIWEVCDGAISTPFRQSPRSRNRVAIYSLTLFELRLFPNGSNSPIAGVPANVGAP